MKKWFVVLCFSLVSVAAFAQRDPHSGSPKNFSQKDQQGVLSNVMDKMSSRNGLEDEFHNMGVALQRKVAQATTKTKAPAVQQQPQTHWPHWPEEELQESAQKPFSDRPSYYVSEEAYKTCNEVEICRTWAQEQAKQEVHFQVLSANLSMPDYHNQHLEVTYVITSDEEKKVFEEDFGTWKIRN